MTPSGGEKDFFLRRKMRYTKGVMIARPLHTTLGKLVSFLLFFALAFSPVTCLGNCDPLEEAACAVEVAFDDSDTEETDAEDQEHPPHACPGCCSQPLAEVSVQSVPVGAPSKFHSLIVIAGGPAARIDLFRPPRV